MNLISRELQVDTINWYKNKYKDVQKEFQQVKAEFFWSTDQYKVLYAYEELRKKMNRIRHSYDEEKNRKIESLSLGSQNRNENVEPNKAKQSVKEKVKLIRRERNKRIKRRKMRCQKERRRRFKKIQKKRKIRRLNKNGQNCQKNQSRSMKNLKRKAHWMLLI